MRASTQVPAGDAEPRPRPATRAERGQALVIVAMALIGLLAFIGLMVDGGILFIGMGHLRRAADAAALAASAQFRLNRTINQRLAAASEVAVLNGVAANNVQLFVCVDRNNPNSPDPHNDPTLCPKPGDPQRKLQKIVLHNHVTFAFLTIIGFSGTDIVAGSTSEAASVDVVVVIDTSDSMAFDTPGHPPLDSRDCSKPPNGTAAVNSCLPFEEVKQAAKTFISQMYLPYDRLALVTFDSQPKLQLALTNTLDMTGTLAVVDSLEVSPPHITIPSCSDFAYGLSNDPSTCANTGTGGGLHAAYNEFSRQPIRQESVWVVILLTDGATNASEAVTGNPNLNPYCPAVDFPYFCRGGPGAQRHTLVDPAHNGRVTPFNPNTVYNAGGSPYALYNTEDYARDWVDLVGCSAQVATATDYCKDTIDYNNPAASPRGGQGAVMFSIGLGKLVIADPWPGGPPNAGDTMLRYISNVGIDGDPNPNPPGLAADPCVGVAVPPVAWATDGHDYSYNCGNYYLSKSGAGLESVFLSIASRVFTRLTQ
jgi:hypothetical protein